MLWNGRINKTLLNEKLDVKISDFGLSRMVDINNQVYSKSEVGPLVRKKQTTKHFFQKGHVLKMFLKKFKQFFQI